MIGGHLRSNLNFPVIAHPLDTAGISEDILDLDGALMDLHLDAIDLAPQLRDILPIDIHLDPSSDEPYRC